MATFGALLIYAAFFLVLLLLIRQRATQRPTQQLPKGTLRQYTSTFNYGDDVFEDSIAIETSTGEFLGEMGLNISATAGVGDPNKVTAIDFWTFDRDTIHTHTKVLMTPYCYNDPTLRQELALKGEAVLATQGLTLTLPETRFTAEAHITKIELAPGPKGQDSVFAQLKVDIVAKQRIDNTALQLAT